MSQHREYANIYRFHRAEVSDGIPDLKKYENVMKVGDRYIKTINSRDFEIIFEEDAMRFLRDYFDNPATGYKGRDRLYDTIKQEFIGVSKRAVENFLKNLETQQV